MWAQTINIKLEVFACVCVCAFGGGVGVVLAGRMDHEYRRQRRHGGIFEYLSPICLLNDHVFVEILYYIIQVSTALGVEIFYMYICVKGKKIGVSDGT